MELTIAFSEKPQDVIASRPEQGEGTAKQSPIRDLGIASQSVAPLAGKPLAMTQDGAFVFDLILDGESHLRGIPFTDPLTEKELKDLRWYLEEYLDWPFNEPVRKRAQEIERNLDEWGAALFGAVFAKPEARVLCDRLLESKDEERFLTIQSPDARVLRLPWELNRQESFRISRFNEAVVNDARVTRCKHCAEQHRAPLVQALLDFFGALAHWLAKGPIQVLFQIPA